MDGDLRALLDRQIAEVKAGVGGSGSAGYVWFAAKQRQRCRRLRQFCRMQSLVAVDCG